MLNVSMDGLKKAVMDFYNITGLLTVLFNEDGKFIYSYPDTMCDYCKKVRQYECLNEGCFECDKKGFDECSRTGEMHIYRCHMGLEEAVIPIKENGIVIGYMMLGQIFCPETRQEALRMIEKSTEKHGLSPDIFKELLEKMPQTDRKYLHSAAEIMSMCAGYLYFSKIITNKKELIGAQIADYIRSHISEKITVSDLCRKFFLSKTGLYNLSFKNFGMGITEYIIKERFEKAKELIKTTDKSISNIAAELGYDDVNYFIRLFRSKEGMTPGAYRKMEKHVL